MHRRFLLSAAVILSYCQFVSAEPEIADESADDPIPVVLERSGLKFTARTANFHISTTRSDLSLKTIAQQCERDRTKLLNRWLGAAEPGDAKVWSPCCEIVIHAKRNDYVAFLGAAAGSSVGCTTISVQHKKISQRRIDVRSDAADWITDALPHELTHVILADRFGNTPLPLWADEGMAVLSESESKRRKRLDAAIRCENRLRSVSAGELLFDDSLARSSRVDAFYCRSSQLVSLLVERQDGPTFVRFIEQAMAQGYERSLQQHYSIESVGRLQPLLDRYVTSGRQPTDSR